MDVLLFIVKVLVVAGVGAIAGAVIYHLWTDSESAVRRSNLQSWERSLAVEREAVKRLKNEVEASRAENEQKYQQLLAAAAKAAAMVRRVSPDDRGTLAGVSRHLRDGHGMGAATGEHLSVVFLASPDGFIEFEWEVIQWAKAHPPRLRLSRDRKTIRTDFAMNGRHKDRVEPGGRYMYCFSVLDPQAGDNAVPKRLRIEITTPPAAVWDSDPPGAGKQRGRKRLPGGTPDAAAEVRRLIRDVAKRVTAGKEEAAKALAAIEQKLRGRGASDDDVDDAKAEFEAALAKARKARDGQQPPP